jgi:hypothetical protein
MRWRDVRFEKPTEHDQEGYSGEVLVAYKDNTKQAVHWMDIGKTDATHWAPLSELPDPPDRIPDPPEGWRFVEKGDAFDKRAMHWNCGRKQWVTTGNLHGYSRDDIYVAPVDPPVPQYRPFANAAEFEPHKNKWWRYKSADNDEQIPPALFNDKIHGVQYWQDSFENKVFSDGTPFGVKVET